MDFDKLVEGYKSRSCVISVEKYPDGAYGNIRIAAANRAHREDAEKVFHRPFEANSPYYHSLPQDKNFEDFMYRSACLGEPLHTYVHLEQMGLWVNMFLLPLESEEENVGYCLYAYDISPYANTEQQASLAADTATAALGISIKLGAANKENYRQVYDEIMEDIRQLSAADHCGILLLGPDGRYGSFCKATAAESDIHPEGIYHSQDFPEIAESFVSMISGSSCAIIKDENDRKWLDSIDPKCCSLLDKYGINSLVLFPLKRSEKTLGYLWVLNFNVEEVVKIKEVLELSTAFIASELANYQLMTQLEYLSTVDLLTGCKNRNAMNNVIDGILEGSVKLPEPYAVVFADLNGLKRINDENGHTAGDRHLRTAAAILSQAFCECDVYRAGGDEFMMIVSGLTEEELKERIGQINETFSKDVHFAFGYHFADKNEDILAAMRIADENMYSDKNEYYEKHPEKKYR